jgi:ribose 5-phosphate isomerase B
MKVYIGADHRGFFLKKTLSEYLGRAGYEVINEGEHTRDPDDDYPIAAQRLVKDLLGSDDKDAKGILICGSGQGVCMAANRFKGIRALLGYDRDAVKSARTDDDANVLCLPANVISGQDANILAETFLNTTFVPEPRYIRRIREMDDM